MGQVLDSWDSDVLNDNAVAYLSSGTTFTNLNTLKLVGFATQYKDPSLKKSKEKVTNFVSIDRTFAHWDTDVRVSFEDVLDDTLYTIRNNQVSVPMELSSKGDKSKYRDIDLLRNVLYLTALELREIYNAESKQAILDSPNVRYVVKLYLYTEWRKGVKYKVPTDLLESSLFQNGFSVRPMQVACKMDDGSVVRGYLRSVGFWEIGSLNYKASDFDCFQFHLDLNRGGEKIILDRRNLVTMYRNGRLQVLC